MKRVRRIKLKDDKVYPRARVRLNRADVDTNEEKHSDEQIEELISQKMKEKWTPESVGEPSRVVNMRDFKTKDKKRNHQRVKLPYADPFAYNNDRHPRMVYRLRLLGESAQRIAEIFMVSTTTIHLWRTNFPDFNQAWLEGGVGADGVVAQSLFRRAVGWSHEIEKVAVINGEIRRYTIVEKFAPDITAAKFWLTNRQGGKNGAWSDRKDVNHTFTEPPKLVPNAVSPAQLMAPPTLEAGTFRETNPSTVANSTYDDDEEY